MTVDSRLDDLEQRATTQGKRLRAVEDGQTAILQRLDQIVASQQEILNQVSGLRAGALALQDALNDYRVKVHQAFRGVGNGV